MRAHNKIVRRAVKFAAHLVIPIALVICLFVTSTIPGAPTPITAPVSWAQEPEPTPEPGREPQEPIVGVTSGIPWEVPWYAVNADELGAQAAEKKPVPPLVEPPWPAVMPPVDCITPTAEIRALDVCFPLQRVWFYTKPGVQYRNSSGQIIRQENGEQLYLTTGAVYVGGEWYQEAYVWGDSSQVVYVHTCDFLEADDYWRETNQSASKAFSLGVSPVSITDGVLARSTDEDYYSAWIPEGQVARGRLYNLPVDYDLYAYKYISGQWVLVASSNKSGTSEETVEVAVTAAGYIIFRVRPYATPPIPLRPYSLEVKNLLAASVAAIQANVKLLDCPGGSSVQGQAGDCLYGSLLGYGQGGGFGTGSAATGPVAQSDGDIYLPLILKSPGPPPQVLLNSPLPIEITVSNGQRVGIATGGEDKGFVEISSSVLENNTQEYLHVSYFRAEPIKIPGFGQDYTPGLIVLGAAGLEKYIEYPGSIWDLEAFFWLVRLWWHGSSDLNRHTVLPYDGPLYDNITATFYKTPAVDCGVACPGVIGITADFTGFSTIMINNHGEYFLHVEKWTVGGDALPWNCAFCLTGYEYIRLGNLLQIPEVAALWVFAKRLADLYHPKWRQMSIPGVPQPAYVTVLAGGLAFGVVIIIVALTPTPLDDAILWIGLATGAFQSQFVPPVLPQSMGIEADLPRAPGTRREREEYQ